MFCADNPDAAMPATFQCQDGRRKKSPRHSPADIR